MYLCSALERPLRSTTAARRISRADRGLPQHSSCSRSLPRNRLSCSATRASERCDSMAPSSAWCCKMRAGTLQRPGATRADAAPSAHDMARCACEGGEGSCSGVRWRNPTARANTAYPQKLEHRPPAPSDVVALASASLGGSGGLVVETYSRQLGHVEEGGNEAAHAGNVCVIPCRRVRHIRGAEADGYADDT